MPSDILLEEAKSMFLAALELGRMSIRAAFLLNGGAIVGLMALLGNIYGEEGAETIFKAAKHGLPFFIIGVFCAAIATAIAFLSQEAFYQSKSADLLRMDHVEGMFAQPGPKMALAQKQPPSQESVQKYFKLGTKIRLTAIGFTAVSLLLFLIGSFVVYSGF